MAQLADHQLMTLVELAALNGAGDEVADGGEERAVLRAERARPVGADAENAVGAAVAPGDHRAHAADAAMVLKIPGNGKAELAGEVGNDDGPGKIEDVPRIVAVFPRGHDRADAALLPAKTGAQQQVGVAGQEFEDLNEIDRQCTRDRVRHVLEQPFDVGFNECPLAELGQRCLLPGAAADLVLQPHRFGDVVAQPDHAGGRAVLER